MSDKETQPIEIGVPTGQVGLEGQPIELITVWQYLVEHRFWMILAAGLIVLPPIIGYVLQGVWTIVFGMITGATSFYVGSKATMRVIERNRS